MTPRPLSAVVPGELTSDGAGVRLRRTLGSRRLDHLDPFLLLDEFRSDDPDDYIAGFPDHPHRGFETVTYLLAGSMRHQDHRGHAGTLGPGTVQWMTAGRGIIHSEMPQQEDGLLWGFQLWVNLPAHAKLCEPRYQEFPASGIPEVHQPGGATLRVVAGEAGGARGPVEGILTQPLYLDVAVPPRARFEHPVPEALNACLYVFAGEALIDGRGGAPGQPVPAGHLGVLGPGEAVRVSTGSAAARFLLLAARPLGEPIVRYGPFVMTRQAEIAQAIQDYQSGAFLT